MADKKNSSSYGSVEEAYPSADVSETSSLPDRRKIGTVSAVFIIFNRMIGTGVFATPSTILSLSGSVGMALFMWVIGAIIAAAGMWVYVVWGTVSNPAFRGCNSG